MAQNNNFSDRGTLKYEMQKQFKRYERRIKRIEDSTLKSKYEEAGLSNEALKQKLEECRKIHKNLTRAELSKELAVIKDKHKKDRKAIEKQVIEEHKKKFESLTEMVKSTPLKYKVLNDELDPGIVLIGNPRKQKITNKVDDTDLKTFHKNLEENFFAKIVNAFDITTDKKQSTSDFLIKNIEVEKMNYTHTKAKNVNQGTSSMIEAYKHMLTTGQAVGYDLETIGGIDAHGIWKPKAITEYSFQTYDIKNKKVTKDVTAVMGISEKDAREMYNQIIQAIDNNTLKDNNDLWVTANRMMKYGHTKTKFEKGANGLTRAIDFVNEDAVSNVFDKEQIWEGFKKHIDVFNNATEINGMKDYEYHFLNTIANIKKKDLAVLGFNDAYFDSPILDSQMNMIVDRYRDNPEAMEAISKMFGGMDNVKFNPDQNRRLDLRSAINLAVDKKGYGAVYGKNYDDFLNEKALSSSMVVRQEYLVERHFNEAFNSGTAHLAVEDVGNLLRLGFESSDKLDGETLLGSLMNIIGTEYTPDKVSVLTTPKEGTQTVLFANRNSQAVNYTGRGVLGFTVDSTNGSYKTGAGFMVGNASEAIGDISRQNIKIGGHIDQNQFYSFGGIQKMTMTDEFIKEANKYMPEYARREMYVVKLDKMVSDKYKDHEMANTSTFLFFNELAEATGQISSMTYVGNYTPGKAQTLKKIEQVKQVYAKDKIYKKTWAYDSSMILTDIFDIDPNSRVPKTLKSSKGWTPTSHIIKTEKNYNSPKGYTFAPRKGDDGYAEREGILYRSKSNKDLKYAYDPETEKFYKANVVKQTRVFGMPIEEAGEKDFIYSLKVSTEPAMEVPDDLEVVYNWNRVLKTNPRLEYDGDNQMKPLMKTKNGKGYYMAIGKDGDEDLYVNYFHWENYKRGKAKKPMMKKAKDFRGGLQPATAIDVANEKDSRLELRILEEKVTEVTSKGVLELNGELTKEVEDIITGVSTNSKGKLTAKKIGTSNVEITKAFEEAIDLRNHKTITDRARRHAVDKIYKNSRKYAKLIEEMEKHDELKGMTGNADSVKNYLLSVATRLSDDVSRNKILNGQDRDSLVIAALGYVPKDGNGHKYLYGSTLHNFIQSNDVFYTRNKGMNNLFDFVGKKNGVYTTLTESFEDFHDPNSSKYLATTQKFESMYNYLLNKAAQEHYSDSEELKKAINMYGEASGISKHELKSYFEFDVSNLGKENKYMQTTINSLDNTDVLRINLKSGDEYSLINKVFTLYKGEFAKESVDGEVRKADAMRSFILDMQKRNKALFNNQELADLVEDVTKGANGGTISPQVMANRLIRGLRSVKEEDFSAGIIKTDFNIADLAVSDNKVMQTLNDYLHNDVILKEAYDKTAITKNMYNHDKAALKEVIDKYFMPTFNGKTGDDALHAILDQGIYTKKQARVVELNWKKAQETHQEIIGKLLELVSQGDGKIHVNDSGINIEINGKMTNFDGLAKTRYENGLLYHQVGNSKVTAQLDLGWDNKSRDFKIESNLKEIFSKSYADYNMKKINKEIDAGEFSIDTLSLFVGKIQGSALEEAVITDMNLHERNSQLRLGIGNAVGKHLEELIGTDEAPGRWGNLQTIDQNIIRKIRKITTSDNWKDGKKELTPELKELIIKNVIPMLNQTVKSEEVLEILGMATFSNKDTQIAKASTDIHLGERYSQQLPDNYDNAQRPVTAAQKKIFERNKLEAGIQKYIKDTNNNKDVFVGTILDEASTYAMKSIGGIAIDGVEQSITFGKANVGQVALMAIVDNNFEKILAENDTISNLSKHQKELQFHRMKRKMNVYEQEKVIDARLMDAIFEMGANKQFVSTNKDYMAWIKALDKTSSDKDLNVAQRLAEVKSRITIEDGQLKYTSTEGRLVDRGETILKYIGFGNRETAEHSKQFMGRLQYGVFEEKGDLKLSDAQVSKFLQDNRSEVERLARTYSNKGEITENAMSIAAQEVLSKYFKVGFYVEDIRQKTYMKVMNEGVEKDMTNGLYVGLGQLDSRISKYLQENTYQDKSLSNLEGQVLTMTEIDKIFVKNFKANDDFKTAEELLKAIKAERYYDSVSMFDVVDEFKKSSMITSHAVAKHNNSGMIFQNTIGSIFSIYKKDAGGDHQKALEKLRDNLVNNDVVDMFDDNGKRKTANDVLEITKDGRMLHHSFKTNQAEMSNDMFNTIDNLNIENLISMIKNDDLLKKELIHEGVKVYDPDSDSKYKITDVYGDVIKTNLVHKDGTILKDIVVGTRAQSGAEIAIDAEYMTVYDYNTVKGLEEKAKIDTQMINNRLKIENLQTRKKNAIAQGIDSSDIDEEINKLERANMQLRIDKARVNDEIGTMTDISKGKKIGNQEFFIYNMQVMNEGTASSVNSFLGKEAQGIDDKVLASLKANFSGILVEDANGAYELHEDYKGYKVLDEYMKNIKARNLFKTVGAGTSEDTGLELALTEDMLELDEYKHLKSTYKKVRAVADEHVGPDANISVRYAEQAYQIDMAHTAYKYNKGQGLIREATLENYGFDRININDLIVSGAEAENLSLNSMFNTNYLLDLDEFGTLALPKAGKITGDDSIKESFQSSVVGIQQAIKEYRNLYTTEESEEALAARARITRKIEEFKENLRESIYDKGGMLYNAGKTEVEESFRVKSSTASVLDSEVIGEGHDAVRKSLEVISASNEQDKVLLDKARINGVSISELEKNGIYHDYMFVSSDVFKNLGYFEEENLVKHFNVTKEEVASNLEHYQNKMKEALETHGDIFMGERYPAIWLASDKPMRVFLDDNITDINRARLSMATMLSMNGDNDGDSISAALLKSERGTNYLKYQIAKEEYIANNNLSNARYSEQTIASIDAAMGEQFGADAKFFKGIEAHLDIESITSNRNFAQKGRSDMIEELQTAVANGDVNSIKAIKFNSLYGGKLYANYGGTSSMESLKANENAVNNMIELANKVNAQAGNIFEMSNTKIHDAEDYITHLNDTFKIFDAMQNPNEYNLTDAQKKALNKTMNEMNITDEAINTMREDAVMKARWMDYQSETMAKARKGSIGPINVALQQHRQAVDALYDSSDPLRYAQKIAVQTISKEIEQEVISSKKGNVIFNINKTTDLIDTYRHIWNFGVDSDMTITDMNGHASYMTARESLTSWMNSNLDDKKIKSIVTEIQGKSGEQFTKEMFGASVSEINASNIGAVRSKLTDSYISTLSSLHDSEYARAVRKVSRQGGNIVDDTSVMAIDRSVNTTDMITGVLTYGENKVSTSSSKSASHGVINTMYSGSERAVSTMSAMADKLTDVQIKGRSGLAVGALSFAAGVLVSGFAGGPIDQTSASDYAQQEENNKPQAMSVPTMMDNGGFATTSNSGGYIINVRANTSKDLTQTKKVLKQAASASVGGGVNVNMNIKERSERFTETDLENMIAGIF